MTTFDEEMAAAGAVSEANPGIQIWLAYCDKKQELEAANEEIDRLREALRWYADQMCEFGPHYEGCGKMTDDDCAGCKARAALAQHEAEGRTDD